MLKLKNHVLSMLIAGGVLLASTSYSFGDDPIKKTKSNPSKQKSVQTSKEVSDKSKPKGGADGTKSNTSTTVESENQVLKKSKLTGKPVQIETVD